MRVIKPMKAKDGTLPGAGRWLRPGWVLEIKLDGCRALWVIEAAGSKLRNDRSGDRTENAPDLAAVAGDDLGFTAVLDGEFLAPATADEITAPITRTAGWFNGGPVNARKYLRSYGQPVFAAFDLLELDGEDWTGKPYHERRAKLAELAPQIAAVYPRLWLVPQLPAVPGTIEAVLAAGFEGVMAKREDAVYQAGDRSADWIKIKALATLDVILTGATKAGKNGRAGTVGSVEVAVFGDAGLVPIGYVTVKPADAQRITALAAEGELADLVWEVEANGIVAGKLRHPRYKRTRQDKTPTPANCGIGQLDALPVAA
jgi:bifunctional non-homologous end joining protein LigD